LTLLLLYQSGYHVGKYISIERIYEENKESYYETLEKSSQAGMRKTMISCLGFLFLGNSQSGHIRNSRNVWAQSQNRVGFEDRQIMLAVKRKIGPFAISDIERECQN